MHAMPPRGPRIAIFSPDPLLAVAVEATGTGRDEVHVHAAGQGVWAAKIAAELGGDPVLCGFSGGETGAVLEGLLRSIELRLVRCAQPNGAYVVDRRQGRELLAQAYAGPRTRHEVDELISETCATALSSDVLVVCNPYPAETIPEDAYTQVVGDARDAGIEVLVDLSTPRLDAALAGHPQLVKINDWELAEFVRGPVDGPALREGAERLRAAGAEAVVITRGGKSAVAFTATGDLEIVPPLFERGHREGCGDTMLGAMAVALGRGDNLPDALRLGAAAGAANFLRRGIGNPSAKVVDELLPRVAIQPYVDPLPVLA
jgi:1-phosphofructokinase